MKRSQVSLYIISVLFLLIASCSIEEDEIPRSGEPFSRAPNMRLYFSDAAGVDLLDLTANQILPITYESTIRVPDVLPVDSTLSFQYNGGHIALNPNNNKYFWQTFISGYTGYTDQTLYVRISATDTDTLTVKFRFTPLVINNEPGVYPHIDKLYYNGIIIREGENTGSQFIPTDIFITKNDEKTVITFEE